MNFVKKKHLIYVVIFLLLTGGIAGVNRVDHHESHINSGSKLNSMGAWSSIRGSFPRAFPESESIPLPAPQRASRGGHHVRPRNLNGDPWTALGNCESHNTNDHWAPYYGYFQFSEGTWHGIGESGFPDEYPYEIQLAAAKRLQTRSGWGQWPVCSRKLGLR